MNRCLNVGTLATVYLKPVQQVFRSARPRRLQDSPALQKHTLPSYQAAAEAADARKSLAQLNTGFPGGGNVMVSPQGFMSPGAANGGVSGMNTGGGDLAGALDAADMYFAGVGNQQLAQMQLNDGPAAGGWDGGQSGGGFASTPVTANAGMGQTGYMGQHNGQANDDLLVL
jgi:AP-2 complex subunit beta-1